ncbi:MAG: hypothetical protein AABX16_03685 [Nanoarchaeota archaeon]
MTTTTEYTFEDVKRKIEKIPYDQWRENGSNMKGFCYEHKTDFGKIEIGIKRGQPYVTLLNSQNSIIVEYGLYEPCSCLAEFIPDFFRKMDVMIHNERQRMRKQDESKLESWLQE